MTELRKYPRSSHLPWSPGTTNDDRVISGFELKTLQTHNDFVTTVKMDGSNVTLTRDNFFARSLDSGTHLWDIPAKVIWATIRFQSPEGWRISGESMYARRSVGYDDLPGYYLVFGVWDENDNLLSWVDTEVFAASLALPTVPVLYRGNSFDDAVTAWGKVHEEKTSEGFVVRKAGLIPEDEFAGSLAKWVRAGHVTGPDHPWKGRDDFARNGLA